MASSLRRVLRNRFLVLAIVPLVIFGTFTTYFINLRVDQEAELDLRQRAELQKEVVEENLRDLITQTELITSSAEVQNMVGMRFNDTSADAEFLGLSSDERVQGDFYVKRYSGNATYELVVSRFLDLVAVELHLHGIAIYWDDGNVLAGVEHDSEVRQDYYGDTNYFREVMNISYIIGSYLSIRPDQSGDHEEGEIGVHIPISVDGKRVAVLVMYYEIGSVFSALRSSFGDTGHFLLMDKNYLPATGSAVGPLILLNEIDPDSTYNGTAYIPEEIITVPGTYAEYVLNGEDWVIANSQLFVKNLQLVVVAGIKESEVLEIRIAIQRLAIIVVVLALLLVVGLSERFSIVLKRQLDEVVEVAEAIGSGNFERKPDITGIEELERIGDSVEKMRVALRELLTGVLDSVALTTDASISLSANTEEVNAIAEEMTSTSQSMSIGASEQAEAISKINELVMEADKKISEVLEDIRRNTDLVAGIALQTNILSLNAGIEASRAGDYGRGFAVVASNIRRLSEEVQESINQIQQVSTQITQDLKVTFDSMSEMVQGVAATSEETAASSQEVAAAIEEVSSNVAMITELAAKLQKSATESNEKVNSLLE